MGSELNGSSNQRREEDISVYYLMRWVPSDLVPANRTLISQLEKVYLSDDSLVSSVA